MCDIGVGSEDVESNGCVRPRVAWEALECETGYGRAGSEGGW